MGKIAVDPIYGGGIEWTLQIKVAFDFTGAQNAVQTKELGVLSDDGVDMLIVEMEGEATAVKTTAGESGSQAAYTQVDVSVGSIKIGNVSVSAVTTSSTRPASRTNKARVFFILVPNGDQRYFRDIPDSYYSLDVKNNPAVSLKFTTQQYGTGTAGGTLRIYSGKLNL